MRRLILIAMVAALTGLTVASDVTTVEVTITVIDSSSVDAAGVEGAFVTLKDTEFSDSADESGMVILNDVPHGAYTIVVQADGYLDYSQEVEIDSEQSDFEIKLRPRE